MVNDNKIMVSGSHKDARITIDIEDKVTALAEEDNEANRIALISRTTKNMIGEYSNYASVYLNRRPRDETQKKKYESFTDIVSVLTGKAVDQIARSLCTVMCIE